MIRMKEKGQTLRHCSPEKRWDFAGQALAEFALSIPLLILLIFGMFFAAFYAFRAASADWGVFITGVAAGAYDFPATDAARESILWPDLADRFRTRSGGSRQVRSQITVEDSRKWVFGLRLVEAHRGSSFFRLWRFYPGPPVGGIE